MKIITLGGSLVSDFRKYDVRVTCNPRISQSVSTKPHRLSSTSVIHRVGGQVWRCYWKSCSWSVESVLCNSGCARTLPLPHKFWLWRRSPCTRNNRFDTLTFKFSPMNHFFGTWRFTIPDQFLFVFWDDFAVITPWFTFKLRNPHTGSYIST